MNIDKLINSETLQDLKEGFTHFYIVGVRIEMEGMKPKLALDFVIEYTADHVRELLTASQMITNELLKTTLQEAVDAVGMKWFAKELQAAKLRSRANQCTAHKFKCRCPMGREDLKMFVDIANISDHSRKKLEESKIW